MAVNWTEHFEGGARTPCAASSRACTPRRSTTARKERGDKPTTTGANLAATHSTVIVADGPGFSAVFTAPRAPRCAGSCATTAATGR